ncbi:hypothetical protein ScPMuIL_014673 [Solemya velum]
MSAKIHNRKRHCAKKNLNREKGKCLHMDDISLPFSSLQDGESVISLCNGGTSGQEYRCVKSKQEDMSTNKPLVISQEVKAEMECYLNGCESPSFRKSLHWEEFFGSSLDLTPTLLSIYDSIASGTPVSSDGQPDQETTNQLQPTGRSTNKNTLVPTIQVDQIQSASKNSSKMEAEKTEDIVNAELDSKKRPLSVSSVSSASSSSLPRHSNKRLNIAGPEHGMGLHLDIEKLDNLMYIDDEDGDHGINCPKTLNDVSESEGVDVSDGDNLGNHTLISNDGSCVDDNKNVSITGFQMEPEAYCSSDSIAVSPISVHYDQNRKNCSNGTSPVTYTSKQNLHMSPLSPHPGSCSPSSPPPPVGPICKLPCATSTPQANASTKQSQYISHGQRVVTEIVDTEKTYVKNLNEIKEGYLEYLANHPEVKFPKEERDCLFGNFLEIYAFSGQFLEKLEACEYNQVKVANCFVLNNPDFAIYGHYCTNYPSAVAILTKVMIDPVLSEVFKERQLALGHALPLGAYLLKPVQRVLKYHLLLQNLLKHYNKADDGYEDMHKALNHMTSMAQHINEMKRKHEHAVRVQEIQSQLEDYEGEDLTRLGELVLEGSFRTFGAKTSRQVFLFEKGVVISKRKEDGMLSCKGFIQCSNLMLVESIPKEPVCFQIIPFDNPRGQHTLQSRNLDQKRRWCQEIKRLILESYKGKIPEKVKSLVMQLGKSKEEEDYANVETSRRHHGGHSVAPEYLERRQRQRLRRKSGAIPDMLKNPMRRGANQRRSQSVSPHSSPPSGRRLIPPLSMSETAEEDEFLLEPESPQPVPDSPGMGYSLGETTIDASRFTAPDNSNGESRHVNMLHQSLPTPFQPNSVTVRRSQSFNTAVKRRPLGSIDYGSVGSHNNLLSPSFNGHESSDSLGQITNSRLSTGSHLTSPRRDDSSCNSLSLSPENQNNLVDCNGDQGFSSGANTENRVSIYDGCNLCGESVKINNYNHSHQNNTLNGHSDNIKGTNVNIFGSLPVLMNINKSPSLKKSNSFRQETLTTRSKNEIVPETKPVSQTAKKIIDTKPYFTWDKDKFKVSSKLLERQSVNLLSEPSAIPAMHDSFSKKSTENLASAKQMSSKTISLTKPLSFTNNFMDLHRPKVQNDGCGRSGDPWVPQQKSPTYFRRETQWRKLREQTAVNEALKFSKDNLNWLVYANRNSLPIDGFTEESNKLFKYCTPPRREMVAPGSEKFNLKYPEQCKDVDTSDEQSGKDIYHSENENGLPVKLNPKRTDGNRPLLTRSNSTPLSVSHERTSHPHRHNRTISMDTHTVQESERMVEEMEDYIRLSTSSLNLSGSASKFPTSLPSSDTEEHAEKSNCSSCISTLSTSSYESQGSYSGNTSADSLVISLKNKLQHITDKLRRRSAEPSSKESSPAPSDEKKGNDIDFENTKKCSSVTLTRFYSIKVKLPEGETICSKKKKDPKLSSLLLEGEPGSSIIGSRMAEPFPGDFNPTLSLPRHLKKERGDNSSLSSYEFSSKETSPEPQRNNIVLTLPSIRNLNIQQSDSAVSIQSELDDNRPSSPPMGNNQHRRSLSNSSGESTDSFYERRFSVALDAGEEEFRDSAVYCEMDTDSSNPHYQECASARPPIKAYVKHLEQKGKTKTPKVVKVATREPGVVIRNRLKSLNMDSEQPRKRGLRSRSEEREPQKYFSDIRVSIIDRPSSNMNRTCLLKKQNSDLSYRSRSNTPPSGTLKPAFSTGQLDELEDNIENIVIMKGWVRQLIAKFQKDTT